MSEQDAGDDDLPFAASPAAKAPANGGASPLFPAQPEHIRLAIIDDHQGLREGLLYTFSREPGFETVGHGTSRADAVAIAERSLPDVMLLDMSIPGGGLTAARLISNTCPAVRIVILTALDGEPYAVHALLNGARGYILKGASSLELVNKVRSVYNGGSYMAPALAAELLSLRRGRSRQAASEVALTSQEKAIMQLVCEGRCEDEISIAVGLPEKTVRRYMTNVLQKLHSRNRSSGGGGPNEL